MGIYSVIIIPIIIAIISPYLANYFTKKSEIESREFEIRYKLYTEFSEAYNDFFNANELFKEYEDQFEVELLKNNISEEPVLKCYYSKPLNCTSNRDLAFLIGSNQDKAYKKTIGSIENKFRLSFLKLNLLIDTDVAEQIQNTIGDNLFVAPNSYYDCEEGNSPICGFDFTFYDSITNNSVDTEVIEILRKDLKRFVAK